MHSSRGLTNPLGPSYHIYLAIRPLSFQTLPYRADKLLAWTISMTSCSLSISVSSHCLAPALCCCRARERELALERGRVIAFVCLPTQSAWQDDVLGWLRLRWWSPIFGRAGVGW